MQKESSNLLEIKDLYLHFNTQNGDVQAVDGVNFTMKKMRQLLYLESQVAEKAH